jgi:hypothetical protein
MLEMDAGRRGRVHSRSRSVLAWIGRMLDHCFFNVLFVPNFILLPPYAWISPNYYYYYYYLCGHNISIHDEFFFFFFFQSKPGPTRPREMPCIWDLGSRRLTPLLLVRPCIYLKVKRVKSATSSRYTCGHVYAVYPFIYLALNKKFHAHLPPGGRCV